MNPDLEIQEQYLPYLVIYKSGRFERLKGITYAPASVDLHTGVASKDVLIDSKTGVSARLYLPKVSSGALGNNKKLHVLIYYHGGGFCIESAYSAMYHSYLNHLASKANMIIVSVEYRLAPEHLLPAAYDDSWSALNWVASHAGGSCLGGASDAWLSQHGNFKHIFLAGDSSGGNIAHHMAMRIGEYGQRDGVEIEGLVIIHPYFWGTDVVVEKTKKAVERRRWIEGIWNIACPPESRGNLDHPLINPMAAGAPCLGRIGCRRLMLCVAEKDVMCKKGKAYYEKLKESGFKGEVEMLESKGEDHVFHLFKPAECEKAVEMLNRILIFFNHNLRGTELNIGRLETHSSL